MTDEVRIPDIRGRSGRPDQVTAATVTMRSASSFVSHHDYDGLVGVSQVDVNGGAGSDFITVDVHTSATTRQRPWTGSASMAAPATLDLIRAHRCRGSGGAGNDVIWGGTANDVLLGDDGNDFITVAGATTIVGGAGLTV